MKRTVLIRPRREPPVFVCKKCLKRVRGGTQLRRRLKQELKVAGKGTRKDRRMVLTGCFKICPKAAVVLASGQTLARGEYVLVSRQEEAKVALGLLQRPD